MNYIEYFEHFSILWSEIGRNNNFEFDWVGRDKNEFLAIFISYNQGYIPNEVKESKSMSIFNKLLTHFSEHSQIQNPPNLFRRILCFKKTTVSQPSTIALLHQFAFLSNKYP